LTYPQSKEFFLYFRPAANTVFFYSLNEKFLFFVGPLANGDLACLRFEISAKIKGFDELASIFER